MGKPKEGNWAFIHRKLAKSDLWLGEPFTRGQAWVDLIMLAAYKARSVRIRGARVDVDRGQFATALRFLATRWQWSVGKVQRFLNELEMDKQISTRTSNVSTTITITNYETYQGGEYAYSDTDETQIGTPTDTPVGTQTEQREEKNKACESKRRGRARKTFTPPTVEQVAAYCQERANSVNAQRFVDYYETRGWILKTGQMKDWKASVRYWETNGETPRGSPSSEKQPQRLPSLAEAAATWNPYAPQ